MPARHPPRNLDQPLHAILCRVPARGGGAGWYAVERAAEDMTRAATIRDIKAGQVEDVVAVVAFNPVEHVADDVTEDIAIAIADSLDPGEPISAELRDFIETHAGLDYARGLRVADRSFAAA
jgi:hypothetical protein